MATKFKGQSQPYNSALNLFSPCAVSCRFRQSTQFEFEFLLFCFSFLFLPCRIPILIPCQTWFWVAVDSGGFHSLSRRPAQELSPGPFSRLPFGQDRADPSQLQDRDIIPAPGLLSPGSAGWLPKSGASLRFPLYRSCGCSWWKLTKEADSLPAPRR